MTTLRRRGGAVSVSTAGASASTAQVSGDLAGGEGQTPRSAEPRTGRAERFRWVEALALPLLFLAMSLVFTLTEPQFFTVGNASSVFGTNTVLIGVMVAALLPLIVGEFDLSVGAIAGMSGMLLAVLNTEDHMNVLVAALVAVAAATIVGAVNAVFVVAFQNNSFIVTLGSGTAVTGIVYWISGSQTISGTSASLGNWVFANTFLGIPLQFYYGIAVVLVGWYVLEMTPLGQRIAFVGQSRSVSSLSGIKVDRIRSGTFIVAGCIAGLAGIVAVGTSGSANPTNGPELMLPALAAAFLGSTTIRPGRLNMVGALIAVYFLAVGVDGLELLGVQNFVQDIFYGAALMVAVSISQLLKRSLR